MPVGGAFEIGVRGDDARVLAAHLGDARARIRAARASAARCACPTSYEPVNVTPAVAGARPAPRRRAARARQVVERRPAGKPASRMQSASRRPGPGRVGRALDTTVLPVTSAAATGPPASANGKLNGAITTQTPYGRITLRLRDAVAGQRIVRAARDRSRRALEVVRVDAGRSRPSPAPRRAPPCGSCRPRASAPRRSRRRAPR